MDRTQGHSPGTPLGISLDDARAIGSRLAQARQQRQLEIGELARRARIREHFAEAIEKGEWASLPQGLHGRGLIRIYAKELSVPVPELDPSAHLSEDNARFEKAEQASAQEALRSQTIRSYPAAPASGTQARVKPTPKPASFRPGPSSSAPSGKTPLAKGVSDGDDESPLDVLTPDIASILGLELDDDRPETKGTQGFEQTDDVPSVSVGDVLGSHSEPSEGMVSTHGAEADARAPRPQDTGDHETQSMAPSRSGHGVTSEASAADDEDFILPMATETQDVAPLDQAPPDDVSPIEALAAATATDDHRDDRDRAQQMPAEFAAPAFPGLEMGQETETREFEDLETTAPVFVQPLETTAPVFVQPLERLDDDEASGDENPVFGRVDEVTQVAGNRPERGEMLAQMAAAAAAKGSQKGRSAGGRLRTSATFGVLSALVLAGIVAAYFLPSLSGRDTVSSRQGIREIQEGVGPQEEIQSAKGSETSEGSAPAGSAVAQSPEVSEPDSASSAEVVTEQPSAASLSQADGESSPSALPDENKPALESSERDASEGSSETNASVTKSAAASKEVETAESVLGAESAASSGDPGMQDDGDTTSEETPAAAATTAETPAQGAAEALSPSEAISTVFGAGPQTATLQFKGAVESRLNADGRVVFSGVLPAGSVTLRFSSRAEILVEDGSKVNLTYGSWAHGPLGHEGRSRRLILKEGPFDTSAALASGQ